MAALALATESPTKSLLERKPYGRYEGIITPAMWRNIVGQALSQLVTLFFLLYLPHKIPYFGLPHPSAWSAHQVELHQTLIFNTFVWCQIFNEFNARKLGNGSFFFLFFVFFFSYFFFFSLEINIFEGAFKNTIFVAVLIFTVIVQYLIVQFAGKFASCVPLNGEQWLACIVIGSVSIPVGFVLRMIPFSTTGISSKPKPTPLSQIDVNASVLSVRDAGRSIIVAQRILQNLKKIQKQQLIKYNVIEGEGEEGEETKKDK